MTFTTIDPTSRLVVQTVLRHGPIPRVGVARRTGLSSGSMTRLTTPLVAAGILREQEPEAPKQLGRPALPLVVVDGAARFVGIKVIPGELRAVVTGLAGHVRDEAVRAADTSSIASTAQAIADLVLGFAAPHTPTGIGVAIAAAVDPHGQVRAAPLLGWEPGNLAQQVTRATGLPCTAANDVDALTLAEHWVGHGKGYANFAVLTVGAGVGAGAVVAEELLIGHQGAVGMIGEAWTRDGRRFHDVLSDAGLIAEASRRAGHPISLEQLRANDPACREVLDEAACVLGEMVGLAKLFWGPELVLLTGEGIVGFLDRMDIVRDAMKARAFADIDPPHLEAKELDFHAWARGAAALATRLSLAY